LKEGTSDEKPVKGSKVQVHYTGWLLNGEEFDHSNSPFEFTLGEAQVIKGWDIGVASMKRGESARFHLAPYYAYGERGSPPKIPANSTLVFDVELLDWIPPKPDKSEMSQEALLQLAIKEKELGNEEFKKNNFEKALKHYNESIDCFDFIDGEKRKKRRKRNAYCSNVKCLCLLFIT